MLNYIQDLIIYYSEKEFLKRIWIHTECSVRSQSIVSDSVTPWTIACQAPLSMGFSRQEYWSGLPIPSPEDLPNRGI